METGRTFTNLLKIEKRVYAIGKWKLPRAVTVEQVKKYGIGIVVAIIFFVLKGERVMDNLLYAFLVIPFSFVYIVEKIKMNGKRIDKFFLSLLVYDNRKHYGFEVVRKEKKMRCTGKIICLETKNCR
jgi:hypothetical protein